MSVYFHSVIISTICYLLQHLHNLKAFKRNKCLIGKSITALGSVPCPIAYIARFPLFKVFVLTLKFYHIPSQAAKLDGFNMHRLNHIHTLHGPGCRIGVLTAHSGSLTPEHFRQAGVPDAQIDALAIAGMENFPVFRKTILEGAAPVMDTDAVGAEIGAAAAAMTDGQPLDALLLECTDLSVFARTVQEAVSVPVYDINSLIAYAAFCVRRNQWV